MSIKKRILAVSLAAVGAAVVVAAYVVSRGPAVPKLNVLLITLDTTRADRLGCYGYAKPTSPNLDQLAAESVQFEMAIAQAAVTPVSCASILTGLDPYRHGLRVLHGLIGNRLAEDQVTLAEVWQESGGQTAAFVSAYPVTAAFGLDQGFEHFDAQFPHADGEGLVEKGMVNTGLSQRRADQTTDAAIDWLDSEAKPDAPLLMWVHYFDPHDPLLLPPPDVLEMFKPVSSNDADRLRAIYDAEVFYMDSQAARLFQAFKERGMWDNTLVVVMADHGEGLGDHDWWTHGILYQEQIRVPLILRLPGIEGCRVDSLVRMIDLMPTILEAAAVRPTAWPDMDGESLVAAIQGGRTLKRRLAYSDSVNMMTYHRFDTREKRDHKSDKLYCLMDGTYKLIYHQLKPDETEFYNLRSDPRETTNLAASAPAPMRVLMERLKGRNVFSQIMPGMTPSAMERLRNLKSVGYLE